MSIFSGRRLNLCLLGATAIAVAAQPMRPVVVCGDSMDPTYKSGTLLWTEPLDRPLQRGDVVVVDTPQGAIIKRVALLPGDQRLQVRRPDGWCDMVDIMPPRRVSKSIKLRSETVPPETVFLLGDHLATSIDSRNFGPVPRAWVKRLVIDGRDFDERSEVANEISRHWLADAERKGLKGRLAHRGQTLVGARHTPHDESWLASVRDALAPVALCFSELPASR